MSIGLQRSLDDGGTASEASPVALLTDWLRAFTENATTKPIPLGIVNPMALVR